MRDFAFYLTTTNVPVSTKLLVRCAQQRDTDCCACLCVTWQLEAVPAATVASSSSCHMPLLLTHTLDALRHAHIPPPPCRIAGGYHGKKAAAINKLAAAAPADAANAGVAAVAKAKKEWPIRLLTAYVVRPGESLGACTLCWRVCAGARVRARRGC